MNQRGMLFAIFAAVSLSGSMPAGIATTFLNAGFPENPNKRSLTHDGKKIVDVELVKIGTKLAMRLTYEDGVEQLLVQNIAGQFVPVHKARRQIVRGLVNITKYLGILTLGSAAGAYALYHYGETEGGKRVVPTIATLLRKLLRLSGNSSGSDDTGEDRENDGDWAD